MGVADSYRSKLERVFEGRGVEFIVEKKADAKYAPCSAASVGKFMFQMMSFLLHLVFLIFDYTFIDKHILCLRVFQNAI